MDADPSFPPRLETRSCPQQEVEVEALLDCLPVSLLEAASHQVLELLTSQAGTRSTGPGGAFSR